MELVWIADCKHGQRLNSLNTIFEELNKARVEEFTVRLGAEIIWGMKGSPKTYETITDPVRGQIHVVDTGSGIIRIFEDTSEVVKE